MTDAPGWTAHRTDAGAGTLGFSLTRAGRTATFAEFVEALRLDAAFRAWFNALLAGAPFESIRWETPAVTRATSGRPAEFVVIDSPEIALPPDASAFEARFRREPGADVLTFPNLGRDALLVVPRPAGPATAYGHLGAFVRGAPASQRDRLWRAVGEAVASRLGPRPLWLSTAGGGVPWLHVRLDDRPKYYRHRPYAANRPPDPVSEPS